MYVTICDQVHGFWNKFSALVKRIIEGKGEGDAQLGLKGRKYLLFFVWSKCWKVMLFCDLRHPNGINVDS